MTVLLVLCTLIVFLAIDHVVQKKRSQPAVVRKPLPATSRLLPFQLPSHLPEDVELATNHMWMRTNHDGTITLGVDGFLSRLMGVVETISVPPAGETTIPSCADFSVGANGRSFRLATPVAGGVVEPNPDVLRDPSLILTDPYGKGWLVRLKSRVDDIAASKQYVVRQPLEWLREQVALVRDLIAMKGMQGQSVILQEGGLPVDGVVQQLDERTWEDFSQAFTALRSTKVPHHKETGQ
ncbi:MAG: glycine cleavage system protein H [Bacteroidota bacterium]